MKSAELYNHLERDFIFEGLRDDWARYMNDLDGYLSENFKKRSMGLVCDFTDEIKKVYSAVFPSDQVIKKIINDGITDAMLFLHHPSIWDIRRPKPFYQMNEALLEKFRQNRISIYNLHVPLDNFSEYSTSKTLADALGIEIEKPFMSLFLEFTQEHVFFILKNIQTPIQMNVYWYRVWMICALT